MNPIDSISVDLPKLYTYLIDTRNLIDLIVCLVRSIVQSLTLRPFHFCHSETLSNLRMLPHKTHMKYCSPEEFLRRGVSGELLRDAQRCSGSRKAAKAKYNAHEI